MAAISVKEHYPDAVVSLLERSGKFLSKVKISGGGRCNVMHRPMPINKLLKSYPRGVKILQKTLPVFGPAETAKWFEDNGVTLKTEEDGRMFPVTDTSQTIMDCLLNKARADGVQLIKRFHVREIMPLNGSGWEVISDEATDTADKIIVATGGSPKRSGLQWLVDLGHDIAEPVPSLFTFNLTSTDLTSLQGIAVPNVLVRINGTGFKEMGPALITHWGLSGPAVLKLSSFAAVELAKKDYKFEITVNWIGESNQDKVRNRVSEIIAEYPKRKITNSCPGEIPHRLWIYMLNKADVSLERTNNEIGSKMLNRMVEVMCNDIYEVNGKTTFKDEFVTCGGITAESVRLPSLESKSCPGLYFCGEVLDIDGMTGGFNFQAAWTTGYLAGMLAEQ